MESIIDNPQVREWTTQGLFSKRIVIRYLEDKLDEVLVSIAKTLATMIDSVTEALATVGSVNLIVRNYGNDID